MSLPDIWLGFFLGVFLTSAISSLARRASIKRSRRMLSRWSWPGHWGDD